jgi:pimeloyl-ACP methyl ester carboxylesterase
MKLAHKLLFALGIYLTLSVVAGIVISEASLHLRRLPLRHQQQFATFVHERYGAELNDVQIQAADGVILRAWYVQPTSFNGRAVVLTHGITDNREGVAGYGKIFLDQGYAVLLPDARAHGESGGEIATYGIREAGDLHRWISWLYANKLSPSECVYGFGESYGAALVLQSLAVEHRYCAVAVEDSFSSARAISYERVSGPLHLGAWFGRTLGLPTLDSALVYSWLRYGVDLLKPSPLYAIEHSSVPVLLIQGLEDRSIRPYHGKVLAAAAPDHVRLWLVPNAGHTMAWAASHQEYERRVLDWFAQHGRSSGGSAVNVRSASER